MFDDQHDCLQASVDTKCFALQTQLACVSRFSATAGIISALVPLLMKETVFLLSEYDRHPADKSSLTKMQLVMKINLKEKRETRKMKMKIKERKETQ